MNNENRKNYAIPRLSREHTRKPEQIWTLLNKQDDKWHWVALDATMETHIVTATNIFDALETLQMEINDK